MNSLHTCLVYRYLILPYHYNLSNDLSIDTPIDTSSYFTPSLYYLHIYFCLYSQTLNKICLISYVLSIQITPSYLLVLHLLWLLHHITCDIPFLFILSFKSTLHHHFTFSSTFHLSINLLLIYTYLFYPPYNCHAHFVSFS